MHRLPDEIKEEILQSIQDGLLVLNLNSQVIFANDRACRILETSSEALLEQFFPLSSSLFQKCHQLFLHSLQLGQSISEVWKEQEKRMILHLRVIPFSSSGRVLLFLQDRTLESQMMEKEKDFMVYASHELRSPLTIIRGFAEMLQNVFETFPEKLPSIIKKMKSACDRLDSLMSALLTLAKVENSPQRGFQRIDLISLLKRCLEELLLLHPKAHIQLICEADSLFFQGDPTLFELAILNILENGVKYSFEPAQIEVKVSRFKNKIHIQIKDGGIGISKEDLPFIFDRFYQAHSSKLGGAGLGLSIVKMIIEKHQGQVEISSELGAGSTFSFSLEGEKEAEIS